MRSLPRLLAMLLIALLPAFSAFAKGEQYIARSTREFHIRKEPEATYQIIKVEKNVRIKVLEYGEEWCHVKYMDGEGWCKTEWLYAFHSMDAANCPVPGYVPVIGCLEMKNPVFVQAKSFSGLEVQPGDLLFVHGQTETGYLLPVWREETEIIEADASFRPLTPYAEAQPGDLIAGFTTFYNDETGEYRAQARRTNIENGCKRLSGAVVMPGEEFSFNKTCGMYTQNKGYVIGPSINARGYGWGGGVCQVSTTLYNALLSTPLQVTAMEPHRVTGVSYIPIGLDSAVSAYSDLAFLNTLPYPLRLEANTQNGALTVMIFRADAE